VACKTRFFLPFHDPILTHFPLEAQFPAHFVEKPIAAAAMGFQFKQ
jgi:hypothetical protein